MPPSRRHDPDVQRIALEMLGSVNDDGSPTYTYADVTEATGVPRPTLVDWRRKAGLPARQGGQAEPADAVLEQLGVLLAVMREDQEIWHDLLDEVKTIRRLLLQLLDKS